MAQLISSWTSNTTSSSGYIYRNYTNTGATYLNNYIQYLPNVQTPNWLYDQGLINDEKIMERKEVKNSMSGVYEYVITETVKSKDEVDEVVTKTNILAQGTITAKDAEQARMKAYREIPADKDIERVQVVVRPFD